MHCMSLATLGYDARARKVEWDMYKFANIRVRRAHWGGGGQQGQQQGPQLTFPRNKPLE
jgi:hypothetical protein